MEMLFVFKIYFFIPAKVINIILENNKKSNKNRNKPSQIKKKLRLMYLKKKTNKCCFACKLSKQKKIKHIRIYILYRLFIKISPFIYNQKKRKKTERF